MIVYEPVMQEETFFGSRIIRDIEAFKVQADLIVTNRLTNEIASAKDKVFTRDLFGSE